MPVGITVKCVRSIAMFCAARYLLILCSSLCINKKRKKKNERQFVMVIFLFGFVVWQQVSVQGRLLLQCAILLLHWAF